MARIAAMPCDTSALAPYDAVDLDGIFAQAHLAEEWEAARQEMEALDITSEAGGVNPGDRRAIWSLLRGLAPKKVLEVGTHIGASTVFIAMAQRSLAKEGKESHLTTVDIIDVNDPVAKPWIGHGASRSPRALIEAVGREDQVTFVPKSSLEFLDSTDEKFDFVFIDGSHEAQHVYPELPRVLSHLAPGGHVLLHDYFTDGRPLWDHPHVLPGVYLATERLRREGANFRVRPLGALPWPTKLGSSVTSLALLGKV